MIVITDVCAVYQDICPKDSMCINTHGSFICVCKPGLTQGECVGECSLVVRFTGLYVCVSAYLLPLIFCMAKVID